MFCRRRDGRWAMSSLHGNFLSLKNSHTLLGYPTTETQKAMVRTNREILTGGKKYANSKGKKHLVEEVVFDKGSRE